jgi:hypothetical protein
MSTTTATAEKVQFLAEWENYPQQSKKMARKILNLFKTGKYQVQESNTKGRRQYNPIMFSQIDDFFGLAYTSSGTFAALWICNELNIWADNTRRFYGFAIGEDGQFYALAEDENEKNQLIIKM